MGTKPLEKLTERSGIYQAMQQYYLNPSSNKMGDICIAFIETLAKGDFLIEVPIEITTHSKPYEMYCLMEKNKLLGEGYKAYTGIQGYGLDDKACRVTCSAYNFLMRVAKDSSFGLLIDYRCNHETPIVISREDVFKILFGVQSTTKKDVPMEANSVDEEFLFAEKGLIYLSLEQALVHRGENEDQESFIRVCEQLIYAALYNVSLRVANNHSSLKSPYRIFDEPKFGPVYKVFTNSASASAYGDTSSFAKTRVLLERTLEDGVNGFILIHDDTSVFFDKEDIKNILKCAYAEIESLPSLKKEIMLRM